MSDDSPRVKIFHMRETNSILWERNQIGATDRKWWFYDVTAESKWFTAFCVGLLQPGEAEGFHSHLPEHEGPYECWYVVFSGRGELRTEYGDYPMEQFDAAFMPASSSHQMRNAGTEPLWWGTLSSRGGHPLQVDTYGISCSEDRPGYAEEYGRIMAARRDRGLPTP